MKERREDVAENRSSERDDPARGPVDLHVHTTASDGMYGPARVVELAEEAGVAAVAITDHDTLAGLEAAAARGRELGVEVVPGVELTSYAGHREVHIVGLFVDASKTQAARRVESLRTARRGRMLRMIEKLAGLGVDIDPEEVMAESRGGAVGRPHLAAVVVRRGFASNESEVFEKYLGNDGPAYVKKEEIPPEEAIALVRELGGVAVFAHPGASRLDETLGRLKAAGLEALEVWHPKHGRAQADHYARLAKKRGLLVSGGSDFHGPGRSETPIGTPEVEYSVLEALRERHAALVKP